MTATLNVAELPFVLAHERENLPASPGIYFVTAQEDKIIYIGATIRLRYRLTKGHHRYNDFVNLGFKKIKWLEVKQANTVDQLFPLEQRLIQHFRPILNGTIIINTHTTIKAPTKISKSIERCHDLTERVKNLEIENAILKRELARYKSENLEEMVNETCKEFGISRYDLYRKKSHRLF